MIPFGQVSWPWEGSQPPQARPHENISGEGSDKQSLQLHFPDAPSLRLYIENSKRARRFGSFAHLFCGLARLKDIQMAKRSRHVLVGVSMTLTKMVGHYPKLWGHGPIGSEGDFRYLVTALSNQRRQRPKRLGVRLVELIWPKRRGVGLRALPRSSTL